jgi:hypothetical protein
VWCGCPVSGRGRRPGVIQLAAERCPRALATHYLLNIARISRTAHGHQIARAVQKPSSEATTLRGRQNPAYGPSHRDEALMSVLRVTSARLKIATQMGKANPRGSVAIGMTNIVKAVT